jgi:hypothetical protein
MAEKLTPAQLRRIDQLRGFIKTVEHVKKLVAELEGSRAGRSVIIDNLCAAIARELSQLRQRAMTANVGTVADSAGAMAVLAGRGGGLAMKLRGLSEGTNSLMIQLDQSLKQALTLEKKES